MKNSDKAELTWYEEKAGVNKKQKLSRQKERLLREEKFSKKIKAKQNAPKENHKNPKTKNTQKHTQLYVQSLGSLFNTNELPKESKEILENFDKIISSSHPLNSKQKAVLPQKILELSKSLTSERGSRRLGYMNQTETLSAYTHYFLWWNLVRLTRLFINLPQSFFTLPQDSICLDIGSGPLTIPLALFIARPELRKLKLTWYCMDISKEALNIGEDIFLTVASKLECDPWKIIKVKGEFGSPIKEKANLITCGNMFNEAFDAQENLLPPEALAKRYLEKLLAYSDKKESPHLLIVEPGERHSARFISLLRDALLRKDFTPVSPCTHCGLCPMEGKKGGKWCNYAFSTENAPLGLKKLSEASHLPKERAVLSFIAGMPKLSETEKEDSSLTFRIASDPIKLPEIGRAHV